LANVIDRQDGDLIKAEELARESLQIRPLIDDRNHRHLSCDLLARILSAQGKLGDETRGLCERSLPISIRNEGPDGLNGNYYIDELHKKLAVKQSTVDAFRTNLILAK
jgi:hypothetical protein